MTALTAYFDASGHPSQGLVLGLGGFIASKEKWLTFAPRWNKVLEDAGIKTFHMTDFIVCKREFAGWDKRPDDRKKLLADLREIVGDTVLYSFGSYVVLWDWRFVNENYLLAENDFQPYALAGWCCVDRIRQWCDEHGHDKSEVAYFFEHGDLHQENLKRRVYSDFGIIVHTEERKALPQLQSADFGSWQGFNVMRAHHSGRDPRVDLEDWIFDEFRQLFLAVHYDHAHFSMTPPTNTGRAPSLLRLCGDYNVGIRR